MKFSIATNLAPDFLVAIKQILMDFPNKKRGIEFFGAFPGFKNSLNRFNDNSISFENFSLIVKELISLGVGFNYIINSLAVNYSVLDEEIEYILSMGINTVTVADMGVMKYLKKYPEIKIVVSIIHETKTIRQIRELHAIGNIHRIIFDHSVNHNLHLLGALTRECNLLGIETEVLANELCFSDCKFRRSHYLKMSDYSKDDDIDDDVCGLLNDKNMLFRSSWIRPEDVSIYESLGINYIKLSGRKAKTDFLEKSMRAYFAGKYDGNFFDIMDIDKKKSGVSQDNSPFLSNRKLDKVILFLNKNKFHLRDE